MVFCWRTDDGPLKKGIWILSLHSSTEKKLPELEPFDPLTGCVHGGGTHNIFIRWLVCHMICLQTMKPNLSTCIKIGNTLLAFIYIPTPGSDIMKFRTYTIASEEGWDESVHMWNLDRAFSPNGRRWMLRILASRQ